MKTSRNGCSTALTARRNTSSWRICRSARTILIWQRLPPRVHCRSARHYSRRTRKSRFLFRKSRLPGSRYEDAGMKDEGGRIKKRGLLVLGGAVLLVLSLSCKQGVRRSGIPAEGQAAVDTSLEDIDAGRYEKLYQ